MLSFSSVAIKTAGLRPQKADLLSFIGMIVSNQSTKNNTMITIQVDDYKLFSQDFYNSVIFSLQFHQLSCSCNHSACLTVHAYYKRSVITPEGKVVLKIVRVKCSVCGKTHALLLSSMVPYCQVCLIDQQRVASDFENGNELNCVCSANPMIDENHIKSILRKYKQHWRERLRAESIGLEPIARLAGNCLSFYSAQFMQIRRTFNKLFPTPTQHYLT